MFTADFDPGVTGVPNAGAAGWPAVDEMSVATLGSRWSMVYGSDSSNEFTTAQASGAIIGTIAVCPGSIDGGLVAGGLLTLQAPMVVGMHCSHWRGTCVAHMEVLAGSMDGGRVLLVWKPYPTSGILDNLSFPSCLVDIGAGHLECELEIPWATSDNALMIPPIFSELPLTQYTSTAPPNSQDFSNGFL